MDIITRTEAKARGLTRYYSGVRCDAGHDAPRLVSNCSCTECERARKRIWRKSHKPALSEHNATYRVKHVGAVPFARMRTYAASVDAIPKGDTAKDEAALLRKYAQAARLTKRTGITHRVDYKQSFHAGGTFTAKNARVVMQHTQHES